MQKVFKILLRIVFITIAFVTIVFAIRWINSLRYQEYIVSSEEETTYSNPSDLSLYDTEVEGVEVERIEEGLLNGFHLVPEELNSEGVIVTFGGSEGSPNYEVGRILVEQGYEVYSLFFFGPGELPDELMLVPLEFFDDFLTYHTENSNSDGPITLLGASKGAELVMNLASRYEEIDHIVLYAPTMYSFFSLDQQNSNQSSWSYEGSTVPYLSAMDGSMWETMKMIGGFIFYYPVRYAPVYESVFAGTSNEDKEAARIKIENFAGSGIAFIGGADEMWPAELLTEDITEYSDNIELHIYDEAGHLFGSDEILGTSGALIAFGGNSEANMTAAEASNEILLEQLAEWHNQE